MGLVRDVRRDRQHGGFPDPADADGLGFAGLFVVVPNRDVLWRDALVGGFVTAIVLEIMKSALAYYLTRFPTHTIIYGARHPCRFLLWIYLSWLAVLRGATPGASAADPVGTLGDQPARRGSRRRARWTRCARCAARPGRQPARPGGQRPGQAVAAAPGRAERRARKP